MPIYSLGERRLACKSDEWFIAPSADVVGDVRLGHQASIWFNCVVRGDNETITIGDGSNIQDGSVLHVDRGVPLTIGDNVTVGHKVMLHGCTIGAGTLVGINSVILNRAVIGASCIVAAHALVAEDKVYPDGVMLIGAPARVARQLTPEEQERIRRNAQSYVNRSAQYRQDLKLAER